MTNPLQSYKVLSAIWDHTVFVTCHSSDPTQVNVLHLNSSHAGRYLIYLPWKDGRLSWPWWLVIYQDGLPVRRPSIRYR